jgi:hypothetical protein
MLTTFSWIQTKSLRQSVQTLKSVKSNVTIKKKCSRSIGRSTQDRNIFSYCFLYASKVVKWRELVVHGFTQRVSNILAWYV